MEGLGLDPNMANLLFNLPKQAIESSQKAFKDIPEEELNKLNYQDISQMVLKNINIPQIPQNNQTGLDMTQLMTLLTEKAGAMVNMQVVF